MPVVRLTQAMLVIASMLFAASTSLAAENATPNGRPDGPPPAPWERQPVLKAAMAIGMDGNQVQQFREAVGQFIDAQSKMTIAEMRRGKTNRDQVIKRKTKLLARKMDDAVGAFLVGDQYGRYETYRDTLLAAMLPQGRGRGRGRR